MIICANKIYAGQEVLTAAVAIEAIAKPVKAVDVIVDLIPDSSTRYKENLNNTFQSDLK